jgi:para-aminobenzoate synthetase/4-amino-4-deoxychorismate lyase
MKGWHPLPAEVYSLVEDAPDSVLLESARPSSQEKISRLFLAPARVLEAHVPDDVTGLFAQIEDAVDSGFVAAGFLSYECGQAFEPSAGLQAGGSGTPLAWFGIYERAYLFDHLAGTFVGGEPPGLADVCSVANSRDDMRVEIGASLSAREFAERIEAIHEWIRAGDVYQLNFTFPLHMRATGSAAALYADLRARQPVEFGALLHWQPGRHILSFSPELFFRMEEDGERRQIVTRPMKGTAACGRTNAEDAEIADRLRNDPKNRSENVMIVDLLRNDLGRLCDFGSVRVEELFATERYPTLWQMTSTVAGELRADVGYHDIFRALFPCGSVTGAPKVRAMQLLAQMEGAPRGVYAGAIGFFSRKQTVFNVAIRTLEVDGEKARMGVGSGIVIDSVAADEYRECQLKAEFLTKREEPFSLIETLRWDGGFPLLEMHLDRLMDSAGYFGFDCEREEVKAALIEAASRFEDHAVRRVRLLLDAKGCVRIEATALGAQEESGVVCMAAQRTDARDRFLFHKTTRRAVYDEAWNVAREAGFADVLFLNQDGQVTEGAISNLFVEKDGQWFTPPIECGVLAGVYRRYLLETRPKIEERVLYPDDLKTASGIYLTNAVRGLRRVTIDWAR